MKKKIVLILLASFFGAIFVANFSGTRVYLHSSFYELDSIGSAIVSVGYMICGFMGMLFVLNIILKEKKQH